MKSFTSVLFAAIAVILLVPLASSAPTSVKRSPHATIYNDDADFSTITYNSKGTPWYHTSGYTKGFWHETLSYNNDLSASYTFQYGGDTTFAIYGGKKVDRGNFDVYLNGDYIGSGDAYDASLSQGGPSVLLFNYTGFGETVADFNVTVVNKYDSRVAGNQPYLLVDFIQVTY